MSGRRSCLGGDIWRARQARFSANQTARDPDHQTAVERPPAPASPVRAICPHAIRLPSPAQRLPAASVACICFPYPRRPNGTQRPLRTLLFAARCLVLALPPPCPLLGDFALPPCLRAPPLDPLTRPPPSPAWSRRRSPTARHRLCQLQWRQGFTRWGRRSHLPRRRRHRRLLQCPRLARRRRPPGRRPCRH